MFIKKTKLGGATYIQITKTFRADKKVKHKVILNFGRVDKINKKDIDALISVLRKLKTEYFNSGGVE